ncbi:MAG: BatD family protein [Flammeovirgaceae bacterium]|nr:BatD family protein [Flammeovirgaceae bacterium]
MKFLIQIIFIVFITNTVVGQDVSFTATAPTAVANGDRFRLVYEVNAEGENFKHGDLKAFSVLSGPNLSTSSSVQIINGKMTQSVSYSYVFILQATKEGKYTLPAATIEVKGKKYASNSPTIEVAKARQGQQNQSSANSQNGQISDSDLFVRVIVSDKEVFQGEHVQATIKIYTRVNLAGFENTKFPAYNGFWSEDLDLPNQISIQREVYNGEVYNVGVLKSSILFPQRSGDLVIDPAELGCVVRVKSRRRSNSPFDDFFGSSSVELKKTVFSPKVTIKVKPLPINTRPSTFTGAVGGLNMTTSIDKLNATSNDPITLKVNVSGNGTLKFLEPLKIEFPADFEVYDPKVQNNLKPSSSGVSGTKTFEYLMIPRHHGDYTIPPVKFSYFNPDNQKYQTITSEEFKIHIEKGENDEVAELSIPGTTRENVKMIGSDIRYIKTNDFELEKQDTYLFGSTAFKVVYIASTSLFLLAFIFIKQKRKQESDITLVKNKKAGKMAKKRLKQAELFLKEGKKDPFYKELLNAMWGYIGDKLNMPLSELSKENVKGQLQAREVGEVLTDKFIAFMNDCEFAQFSPSGGSGAMDKDYNQAIDLISELENKIKGRVTAKV